ncbi:hypothetical protein AGRA3207_007455 [Actinomadura graeca]|uniref:Uncharacterized protein n=1 Tax=Actinomadura graeca TaxID=2750812 RepID=A0ABX8R4A5_9ACTN|nr:hypothetical protein [Actinomadura graeca]QXJ25889.1 hypothetical protein AGRA3207_007455 [Actinomadura graeca]
MSDPAERGARASAQRLTTRLGANVEAEVEAALHSRHTQQQPDQYLDPVTISLGTLIVSIAGLTWNMYKDLRKQTPAPSPQHIVILVRQQLDQQGQLPAAEPVLEVVVDEVIQAAAETSHDYNRGEELA